jgi:hypothetical protein
MITDSLWNFTGVTPGQAITATAVSTNVVDLGALGSIPGNPSAGTAVRDLGKGELIRLLCQVTVDFATLTSLIVAIQGATDEAFTSPQTIVASQAIPVASLVAGYKFAGLDFVPRNFIFRYIRLNFTVGGSNATAGRVFATAVEAVQDSY